MSGDFNLSPPGVMGNLTGGANYNTVPLDSTTQGLINQQNQTATQSPGQIGGMLNQNVAQRGQNMFSSGPSTSQTAAKFGNAPGSASMIQAIRNTYGNQANKQINQIVNQNNWKAPMTQGQMLQQAAQNAMSQQNVETQNYEGLMNAYNTSINARAQVLSSVFQLSGSAGSAYANYNSPKNGNIDSSMTGNNMPGSDAYWSDPSNSGPQDTP